MKYKCKNCGCELDDDYCYAIFCSEGCQRDFENGIRDAARAEAEIGEQHDC